jgi:hypothetical protein
MLAGDYAKNNTRKHGCAATSQLQQEPNFCLDSADMRPRDAESRTTQQRAQGTLPPSGRVIVRCREPADLGHALQGVERKQKGRLKTTNQGAINQHTR